MNKFSEKIGKLQLLAGRRNCRTTRTSIDFDLEDSKITLEKLMTLFGGFSTFQIMNGALLAATYIVGTLFVTLVPYMEIPAPLECQDPITLHWFACSESTACSNDYQYRATNEIDNFITSFDLHCSRSYLIGFIGSAFFLGAFFGSMIAGALSDQFGRKPVLTAVNVLQVCAFAVMPFSTNLTLFLICTLLGGFATASCRTVSYILFTEIVDKAHAGVPGNIFNALNGSFQVLVVLFIYFVPHWRSLVFIAFAPSLIVLFMSRSLTESPNFLLDPRRATKRIDESIELFNKMAHLNGRVCDQEQLRRKVADLAQNDDEFDTVKTQKSPKGGIFNGLFRDRVLGRRALIFMTIWFMSSFAYYGVTFQIPTLTDSLNETLILGIIFGLLDTIASVLVGWLTKKYPKKYIVLVCFWLYAVVAVSFPSIDGKYLYLAGASAAKFLVSLSYCASYVHAPEMFPTNVRNTACGLCTSAARAGGVLAPLLVVLSTQINMNPSVVFGISCGLVSCLVIMLPATRAFDDEVASQKTSEDSKEDPLKKPLLSDQIHPFSDE